MRLAIDTGGTFTDLVLGDGPDVQLFKAPTTPDDASQGVLDVLGVAAADRGMTTGELLANADQIVHGTTIGLNAIVTGATARTALLVTEGHRDILTLREGGRVDPFDHATEYPQPYIPRRLTFEVRERVTAEGEVHRPLDLEHLRGVLDLVAEAKVAAVAVSLLWSIVNDDHERLVGAALQERFPRLAISLSHQVNPILREYRRTSSTCIDASLKPVMSTYLDRLESRLRAEGYRGRLLIVTSQGGVRDALDVRGCPIHTLGSGPAMAPIAGRAVLAETGHSAGIVVDTGGTTFDVSVVRDGLIPRRSDTWVGPTFTGHMTGFPAIDVTSIGAGGGSIAWVDGGGLLRVGPHSAGSTPGPASFGRGGTEATVTDAALVMDLLDADGFLDGAMSLDRNAALEAVARVAGTLELETVDAACAIVTLATEAMVHAVEDVTVARGLDPRGAVLIAGGGASGINAVEIARRLGCRAVVLPRAGAALSAAGGLVSDLVFEAARVHAISSDTVEPFGVAELLRSLDAVTQEQAGDDIAASHRFDHFVEARYVTEAWEIDVDVDLTQLIDDGTSYLIGRFEDCHRRLFGFVDSGCAIVFTTWRSRLTVMRPQPRAAAEAAVPDRRSQLAQPGRTRSVVWPNFGRLETSVTSPRDLAVCAVAGPLLVETPYTTLAAGPGTVTRCVQGNVIVTFDPVAP
jgi:N-methylhydantoinase A